MNLENSLPVEHQNVPQAHRGLHDFLYSSDDEHTVADTIISPISSTDGHPVTLNLWCEDIGNAKIAGVYAVLDGDHQTQYIGYSRNVALSLKSHLAQWGTEICALTKVQPFKFPKREDMEQLRDQWLAALPAIPSGNTDNSGAWAGTVKDAATLVMSAAEREAHEEKKLKLRRAMADNTIHQESASAQSDAERRQSLEHAIEDDNWSTVINAQTQETQKS
jgi:hypothetical protein